VSKAHLRVIARQSGSLPRVGYLILLCIAALVVAAAPSAAIAQDRRPYPIFTSEHFVAAMKTIGQAFQAVNAALAKNEIEDSKAYLAISRDRLATTITFWRDRKKDDAIKMLREVLTKMDELDAAISVETVNPAAVSTLVKQVGAGCAACHAVYREQDPQTKAYRLKTGSVQ
jgi:cytochrome c556